VFQFFFFFVPLFTVCTQIFRRWQRADAHGRAAVAAERDAYQQQQQQATPPGAAASPRNGIATATAAAAAAPLSSSSTMTSRALPPPGSPELRALVAVCEWAAAAGSTGARPQDLANLYVSAPEARTAVRACGGARPYCDRWSAFLDFKFDAVAAGGNNNNGRQSAKQQRQMAKVKIKTLILVSCLPLQSVCLFQTCFFLVHAMSSCSEIQRLFCVIFLPFSAHLFAGLGGAIEPANLPTAASFALEARKEKQQRWWIQRHH